MSRANVEMKRAKSIASSVPQITTPEQLVWSQRDWPKKAGGDGEHRGGSDGVTLKHHLIRQQWADEGSA